MPSRRPRRAHDDAVGQVLTFMVAGALFVVIVGVVLVASRQAGHQDQGVPAASSDSEARSLAHLVLDSQGVGWTADPDQVQRLGLALPDGSLDLNKINALRGASLTSQANDKVDYADARKGLGINGTSDFHLRIYPVALPKVYQESRSGLRTGYIGDWQSLATLTVPSGTSPQEIASAQAGLNTTMFAQTAKERLALRDLHLAFNDRVYITTLAPTILVTGPPPLPLLTAVNMPLIDGDVFPDDKAYLDANLPGRLMQYKVLIVGSGVDQSTMTSASVKYAVRDWVLAGGTLIVLGSDKMNYQWLQPLFSVGVHTANGAATAPDPSHPLLITPHSLNWMQYNDHGIGWDIKSTGANEAYEAFQHVIVQNGYDILAASEDGGFGTGRIILTSYLDREVATTISQTEAENFIDNLLLYSDRGDLYLEYGPQQPPDLGVSVAVRDTYLQDTRLGTVPMRVELHLWG